MIPKNLNFTVSCTELHSLLTVLLSDSAKRATSNESLCHPYFQNTPTVTAMRASQSPNSNRVDVTNVLAPNGQTHRILLQQLFDKQYSKIIQETRRETVHTESKLKFKEITWYGPMLRSSYSIPLFFWPIFSRQTTHQV